MKLQLIENICKQTVSLVLLTGICLLYSKGIIPVYLRPVPFVGNAHQPPLQDIHPHCKNNYCPDRHGHACIILKA
mgnify:CR=1 FL=1